MPFLTVIDWGNSPLTLDSHRYIAGANMAFSKKGLEDVGGFPRSLGIQGRKLIYNDELWVQTQLRHKGYSILYDPAVEVFHHVPASRLKPSYLTQRYFCQGVSDAIMAMERHPLTWYFRCRTALGIAKYLLKKWRLVFSLLDSELPEDRRLNEKMRYHQALGTFLGYLGLH